jgi:hypothetical protein
MTVKLVVDNKAGDCKLCRKGVYRGKDMMIDPFRPYSFYHKKCFIDILKKHPLSLHYSE